MTKWYKEWASTVKGRKGRMVDLKTLETILKFRDPGYCSVYSFSEEDANTIANTESSRGMNLFAVASDCLTLDIDKGDEALEKIATHLDSLGVGFITYSSGGKGYHIVIKHDLVYDKRLPYSHQMLAKSLLGSLIDQIDLTLYQHGRLISLPGRIHTVTKKRKQLEFISPGSNVEVVLYDEPSFSNFKIESDLSELPLALLKLADLSVSIPLPGTRHVRLWSTAKTLCEAGLDFETTLTLLNKVNLSWETPKSSTEVEQAVKSAYKNITES